MALSITVYGTSAFINSTYVEMHQFRRFLRQDGGPEQLAAVGVHHDLDEAQGFSQLLGLAVAFHVEAADLDFAALQPRVAFRHAHPAQLRVGEDGIGNDPVQAA